MFVFIYVWTGLASHPMPSIVVFDLWTAGSKGSPSITCDDTSSTSKAAFLALMPNCTTRYADTIVADPLCGFGSWVEACELINKY